MALRKIAQPPMGWNSFDCYGCSVHDEDVRLNIDFMSEYLLQYGYEYIVVDNGWFANYNLVEGTKYPLASLANRHAQDITLDQYGRVQASETFYSLGMEATIDYAHKKGLKFGLHLMRGIPRKAVKLKCPIKSTPYTADMIADYEHTCSWCEYNYGIDMSKPGAQEYYDSLIGQLAQWHVDFIKYDDMTGYPEEIEAVIKAIEKVDYPMLLSLSPGGDSSEDYLNVYKKATMLRITADIWDNQISIERAFSGLKKYYKFAHDGFYMDLDMLCIGHLRLNVPKEISDAVANCSQALAGQGKERMTLLTKQQQRTFVTIRAISASPLFIGSDLPTMGKFAYELLTNREMIHCSQNTHSCHPIDSDQFTIWKSDAEYIAIFNCSDTSRRFDMKNMCNITNKMFFRDVWNNYIYSKDDFVDIEPQDVLFMKY